MNKRQARIVAELIEASYAVLTDTPDLHDSDVPTEDRRKIRLATAERGHRILAKHGVTDPFVRAVDAYRWVMEMGCTKMRP